jgi:hypothetical protein
MRRRRRSKKRKRREEQRLGLRENWKRKRRTKSHQ